MKAKIIETDEIIYDAVEVEWNHDEFNVKGRTEDGQFIEVDAKKVIMLPIEKQDKLIDWEERRWIAAKDILCAFESNSNADIFIGDTDHQVKLAICFADELIKQLRNNE